MVGSDIPAIAAQWAAVAGIEVEQLGDGFDFAVERHQQRFDFK